jgi:hypothetical protein
VSFLLQKFFVFFFLILTNALLYIQVIFYIIHDRTATKTRKSSNDARRASFGPYVSFFSFLFVFFILTDVLLYIQVIIYVIHDMEGVGR